MPAELLAWLRAAIEGDLAQARAADEAAPGPWVNTGQSGCGDAWQVHGAPTGDTTWVYDPQTEKEREVPELRRVATLNYDDGGGVWEKDAADHIVSQQPRDTIARCEAELAFLDAMISIVDELDSIAYGEGQAAMNPDRPQEPLHGACGYLVKRFAEAYRHRPGFKPSWLD